MMEVQFYLGGAFIFDVDVWVTLRKSYRILGELVGNFNTSIPTLPSKLLPEETLLLLDKGIAKIIDREYQYTSTTKEKYRQFENDLLAQQQIIQRNNRKKQLETMIDKIVAGKRAHGDNRSPKAILNEELEKSCQVTEDNIIWPTLLTPLCSVGPPVYISRNTILEKTSKLKYAVYRDLWEKGYYISVGHKFGGDFLVYLGDPIAYHAIFIVHCMDDPNQLIHSREIVAFGRLATAVKKRAVLASLNEHHHVSYITINWIDA